jgi:phosphonate transport system substrate-binding protein
MSTANCILLLPRWLMSKTVARVSLLLVATLVLPAFGQNSETDPNPKPVRYAITKSMFIDVNENDAWASLKVYLQTIGKENGLAMEKDPLILDGTNAIARAAQLNQFDFVTLSTEEYLALEGHGLTGPFLMTVVTNKSAEEYVLLVRQDSPVQSAEDLKAHSMVVLRDVHASLALIWLEVLCQEHGLGPAERVFTHISSAAKISQVVLPVFFGKTDACIVTRSGLDVMGEMNPQVKKQLRVVAVSPPIVPSMSCFRVGFSETQKLKILEAAENSYNTPTYKQMALIFKTGRVQRQSESALASTRDLLARYRRFQGECNQTNTDSPLSSAPLGSTGRKGE